MANNYAFIDSQNLNLGIQKLGWKLSYTKFRIYLAEKYHVAKAYMFIGYLPHQSDLYDGLRNAGFILIFKPTVPDGTGKIKGNVDADLVLHAALKISEYDAALIVTSDGDFYSLVGHLYTVRKLVAVLSPDKKNCSVLLRKSAREKIYFMDNLRAKLEYKRKTPLRDETRRGASR